MIVNIWPNSDFPKIHDFTLFNWATIFKNINTFDIYEICPVADLIKAGIVDESFNDHSNNYVFLTKVIIKKFSIIYLENSRNQKEVIYNKEKIENLFSIIHYYNYLQYHTKNYPLFVSQISF